MGYPVPVAGLPPQTQLLTDRARFTEAYAVIPRGVQRDIVTSRLPHWQQTRLWVLARPLSGFAETFSQYVMEVGPGGGADRPDDDGAESVLFVVDGGFELELEGTVHHLRAGSFAFIPADSGWRLHNRTDLPSTFHWIRKAFRAVAGIDAPPAVVVHEDDVASIPLPDTGGRWTTKRFVDSDDVRYDMHVNIVTFEPGAVIPFLETHVMEHGLYVLEGKAVYRLNEDWVEVEEGDFMWLRAFCPQACYAGGPGRFRYLLYKDVNRHMPLPL